MWWLVTVSAALLILWLGTPSLLGFIRELKAARKVSSHPWPVHWLLGDVLNMAPTETFLLAMQRNVQKSKTKMLKIWLGPTYVYYVLHHPSVIKPVLKSPKNEVIYNLFRPWIGDGLLVSSGKKWHRNRHLLTPAFHYEILKAYVPVYNSGVRVMMEKWEVFAKKGEPIKVFETVGLLSLDVVLQCAFSYRSNCQLEGEGQEYVRAVYHMAQLVVERSLSFLSYFSLLYWCTPGGREMARCCKIVHDHSEQVIKDRKEALGLQDGSTVSLALLKRAQDRSNRYLDFLDILLTARDEDGKGLTDLEIRDEADTFMFEGHDTTTMDAVLPPEHQYKIRVSSVLMG